MRKGASRRPSSAQTGYLATFAEQVTSVLSDVDAKTLRAKLRAGGRFVRIKRELTPKQQEAIKFLMGKLYPVKWGSMEFAVAPILWERNGVDGHAKLGAGEGEVVLKGVKGPDGKQSVLKNVAYWGAQKPHLEGIVFQAIPDESSIVAGLRRPDAGTVHVGGIDAVGEVGIAIAELVREVATVDDLEPSRAGPAQALDGGGQHDHGSPATSTGAPQGLHRQAAGAEAGKDDRCEQEDAAEIRRDEADV